MPTLNLAIIVLILAVIGFWLGKRRAELMTAGEAGNRIHSLPSYYGTLIAFWCGIPALIVLGLWKFCEPVIITNLVVSQLPAEIGSLPKRNLDLTIIDIKNLAEGNPVTQQIKPEIKAAANHYRNLKSTSNAAMTVVILVLATAGLALGREKISASFRARDHVEKIIISFLVACSSFAILTTIGIVLSVLFEAIRFFRSVPIANFLFGLKWSPQMAIRADQVGSSGAFGAIPVFAGTALISGIAMIVAVPLGLMSAIYLSEYAHRKFRAIAKPLLEILAGIPTVVYGFFAALSVAPMVRSAGEFCGLDVSSESALAAGAVMGIMIIPFISSLSDDVITAVPRAIREGSYALGATKSETIRLVVLPAALPGIVGGVLLAMSRAIGETMIVVMAAGLTANLTANPLQAVTTVTVQIVTLLVGDQEFDSPKTLAAFALGLILFVLTLLLNIVALRVVRRYREKYE